MNRGKLIRKALREAQGEVCVWCDRSLIHWGLEGVTIDHWHPRSRGGGNDWSNLFAMHGECNRLKGSRWPLDRPRPFKRDRRIW